MDVILAVVILTLIVVLFIREIKSQKAVDLFVNIIVSFIAVGTSIFSFYQTRFNFSNIENYIYIIVTIVAIIYTLFYLIKYFKNKKVEE